MKRVMITTAMVMLMVSAAQANTIQDFGSFITNGTAATESGDTVLHLTDALNSQTGSAWTSTAHDLTKFTASFTYDYISGSGNPADGFTVGFQNNAAGVNAIGGGGGGLGFSGMTNSAAVAFNIFAPNGRGIALVANGAGVPAAYTSVSPIDLVDANTNVDVLIDYDSSTQNLDIMLTQGANVFSTTIPGVDLPGILGSNTALVGFTAATGGENAHQHVQNFNYRAGSAIPEPAVAGLLLLGLGGLATRRRRAA